MLMWKFYFGFKLRYSSMLHIKVGLIFYCYIVYQDLFVNFFTGFICEKNFQLNFQAQMGTFELIPVCQLS